MEQRLGHADVAARLASARASGRLGHAYLFVGRDGVGKGMLAREFASSLLCAQGEARAKEGLLCGCGACAACRQVASGGHPDLAWVRPEEEKRIVSIKAVRDAQDHLSLQPYGGAYRVAVFEEAGGLSHEASNALLKTLEEPGAKTVLILIAAGEREFLPTIRSRCQTVRFTPVPQGELAAWLQSKWKLDPKKAAFLAGLSGGAPGFCARWQERDGWKDLELWREVEAALAERGPWTAAQLWLEALEKECETQEQSRGRLRELLRMVAFVLEQEGRADLLPAVVEAHEALDGNVHLLLTAANLLSRFGSGLRVPR